jgi:hypothetical protein
VGAAASGFELGGRRVGVPPCKDEPNRPLMDFLIGAGASVDALSPYVHASDAGDERWPGSVPLGAAAAAVP